jgi:hypothetical protein
MGTAVARRQQSTPTDGRNPERRGFTDRLLRAVTRIAGSSLKYSEPEIPEKFNKQGR